jgi:hypothetical protein
MFVKVKRLSGAFEFTLVDTDLSHEKPAPMTVLVMGTVEESQLNTWQAWYEIAENLVCADLDIDIKRNAVRDLSDWLPPLSRERLLERHRDDLAELARLGSAVAAAQLEEPVELNEEDPLTIVADWLAHD